jgi:hypothetical protein
LRGLFGCDFIVNAGTPWLTEVNPRYTAAMELAEHRLQASLVALHVRACQAFDDPHHAAFPQPDEGWPGNLRLTHRPLPPYARGGRGGGSAQPSTRLPEVSSPPISIAQAYGIGSRALQHVVGKIILFADRDLTAYDARTLLFPKPDDRLPFVADLPAAGQNIPAGQPVCSLFTYDQNETDCIARLTECARMFRERCS